MISFDRIKNERVALDLSLCAKLQGISIMNARPPSPMADTPMSPEGLHLADISSAPPHSTNHDKCSLEGTVLTPKYLF